MRANLKEAYEEEAQHTFLLYVGLTFSTDKIWGELFSLCGRGVSGAVSFILLLSLFSNHLYYFFTLKWDLVPLTKTLVEVERDILLLTCLIIVTLTLLLLLQFRWTDKRSRTRNAFCQQKVVIDENNVRANNNKTHAFSNNYSTASVNLLGLCSS